MRRVAVQILHDDDLVNDAVQESFVRLWRIRWRLGLMKDPQGFSMRTLRNYCIDMLRHNKQRQKMMEVAVSEVQIQQYDDDTHDIELRYRQVEQAIASLPKQQQTIIEMKYVKQMTIHEIAQQTSLSETNITTQLSRAYATLRSEISKQNP